MTWLNTAGFTSQYFGDATAARAGLLTQASQAEDQRAQTIGIAQRAADAATKSNEAECAVRDPRCRRYEAAEQTAFAERDPRSLPPILRHT
jgi:hypothetical protein